MQIHYIIGDPRKIKENKKIGFTNNNQKVLNTEDYEEILKEYLNDGYLSLNLDGFNREEIEKAQVILKTFEKSLESVILSLDEMFGIKKRKEYITLLKEEV